MKTPIFSCLKTSLVIVGTVIGAGFISGREILSFFYGKSIIISIIILFLMFFVSFYLLLNVKTLPDNTFTKVFEPIILFANLIITSGMLSSVDEIFYELLPVLKKIPIFSIITLILSNIIISKGVDGLKFSNLILVPVIVITTIIILLLKNSFYINYSCRFSLITIICYVGVNTFTSSTVFIDLGKSLSNKETVISAIISSFILCALIFLIFTSLNNYSEKLIKSAIPMIDFLKGNDLVIKSFSILMYFGVVTTLFSSHYPLFKFCQTFQKSKIANAILFISAFAISRLGFYNIVNYVYPILGIVGFIYLIVISILSISFRQ